MATKKERLAVLERDLFKQDQYQDPRTRTRTVPMEVLNMSFNRTGTFSMQVALNMLGYSSYHSYTFFSNIRDCDMWDDALNAKFFGKGKPFTRTEWDQLLGHYSAVSADTPAIAFAEDLIAAYSEAKVVLVERDVDSWYKSWSTSIVPELYGRFNGFVAALDPGYVGKMKNTHLRSWQGMLRADDADGLRAHAKERYQAHYEMVRRVTPPERLLDFKLSSGWGPLCEFLGKDVPQVEFPHVNDADEVTWIIKLGLEKGGERILKKAAVWGLPVLLLALLAFYLR